jgi:hypothetical protein
VAAAPALSTVAILPPPVCQYLFNPDGSLSGISADVTLLDVDGAPIPAATIVATLTPVAGTITGCLNPPEASAVTDADGEATVTLGRACGCGTFNLNLASFCPNDVTTVRFLGAFGPFPGTSPDLNGSCDVPGPNPVDVVDLGIWAGCLGAPALCCDYTCDGAVDVLDLAIWASGLLASCF